MSVGLGTAIGYLTLDASGFARGIDDAYVAMGDLENKFSTTSKGLKTIGSMFSSAGTKLTAGLTAPVIGFGAASVKAGTNFDSAMSQVSAVSKATGGDLELIRDRAIEMGEKTRYSATEVSNAMYYMGLAGWDAKQIYAGIPGVLALGAASGENLARVSDIVTDSLTAFGKSADDTTEFVNVLAEASRSSNTTVDLLGEAFKYVAPVAGAFGYSIQDASIMLGIFANNGVKGSQAGTGMRQALNSLINPSDKAAAQMNKFGVSLFNADGSTKTLMQVMRELRGTFGGLAIDIHDADGEVMTGEQIMEKYGHALPTTDMEKLTAIVQIFGVRALPGMLSVINASESDFNDLSTAIYGAQDAYDGLGTAFGMQQTMLNNVQGDWYLFTSALGTTKIIISDMAKGALRELLQKLTELVNAFNNMTPEQQEQIVKWALLAASIGPVLLVIGKVISTVGTLMTTFKNLKNAFTFVTTALTPVKEAFLLAKAGLSGFASQTSVLGAALGGITAPMIAIIALIAVLVAAFVNLWKTNEDFRNKIIEMWDEIKAKFEEAGQKITDAINSLGFNFSGIIDVLKAAWKGFCNLLAPLFLGFVENVKSIISGIVDIFTGTIQAICGVIKGFKDGDWTLLLEGIKSIFDGVMSILLAPLKGIWKQFTETLESLGTSWEECWTGIKTFFEGIWNGIKTFMSSAWNNIKTTFTNAVNTITTFFSNAWNGLVDIVTTVFTTIKNAIQVAFMFIGSLFSAAFQIITLPFRFIWENCKETVFAVWEAIKTGIRTAVNAVKTVIETVFNFILAFITRVVNGWKNIITTVWNAIVTFLSPIIEKIKSIITTAFNNIKTNITTILNAVKTVVSTVWDAIKTAITTVVNAIKTVVTNVFNAVKTTVSTIFNAVKTKVTSIWNGIKTSITNVVNAIKTNIVNGMNTAKTKVSSILDGIKTKFTDVFNNIKKFVKEKVDWLKGIFKFEWKLPDIKLPHFSISGGFSLNPPSVPSFSVDWYAKAMRKGMIMNEPTIFGFDAKSGKFLAGGEAGSEVVVGTGSLLSMIKSAVNNSNREILEQVASYCLMVVNAFKSLDNGILSVLNEALNVSAIFNKNIEVLKTIARDNARLSANVGEIINASNRNTNVFAIDYIRLANELANVLRNAPIQSNVAVEMQDGDIYMDAERVGRKVAPVVSRVVVR